MNMHFIKNLVLFCCFTFWLVVGAVAQEPVGKNAEEFVGELLRRHAYLLSEGERAGLDEVNRRLREAEQLGKRAKDDAGKQAAKIAQSEATAQLGEILNGFEKTLRVLIEDDQLRAKTAGSYALPGDMGGDFDADRCRGGAGEISCLRPGSIEEVGQSGYYLRTGRDDLGAGGIEECTGQADQFSGGD